MGKRRDAKAAAQAEVDFRDGVLRIAIADPIASSASHAATIEPLTLKG
ncbi:hypothetical protein [Catenulispora pinisilvae]|nr:hypothetical protein [Catenulispora pinisilvae]